VFRFGPFTLDPRRRRLTRDDEPIAIPDRHLDILAALVSAPGAVLTKDALIAVGWHDVAVSDNSLEQAISSLRKALGRAPDGTSYIETLARRGYRFSGSVTSSAARADDAALDALLAPHRAFVEGRSALETLDREAIARARGVFERIVAAAPAYAPARVGLANALALAFEGMRADASPDRGGLEAAMVHARAACRLDPASAEAWATLAFVLSRCGNAVDGVAAARRAVALEADNWRHQLRLAYVSWGEERLRAAQRTLKLLPRLALAHWLAATVHVARGALDDAERELVAGTAAAEGQPGGALFSAVGLHLLLGLVHLARGDEANAMRELEREAASEHSSHLYAREACANAWCAIAAIWHRRGDHTRAEGALAQAARVIPGHRPAVGGLPGGRDIPALVLAGNHDEAAARVLAALDQASPGPAGWMVQIDPFLNVSAHPREWEPVLARLRQRAV
jgi:DNA-binding winged helix-turn-helix (wHTH) protein